MVHTREMGPFAFIEAEERGITRENVRQILETSTDPAVLAFWEGVRQGPGNQPAGSADRGDRRQLRGNVRAQLAAEVQ